MPDADRVLAGPPDRDAPVPDAVTALSGGRTVVPLAERVVDEAGCRLSDLDGIAYTQGPGLAGALLVGASVANGLGFALGKPVIGVHHLEGHLLSPLLAVPRPRFPFVALLVSGGHTQLHAVHGVGEYVLLGDTVDDAEAQVADRYEKAKTGIPETLAAIKRTAEAQPE